MCMRDPQERTKKIIKEDIEAIRAYADCFGVEMPDLDENGEVVGLPAPYPREVAGVVRSGYRIYELGQKALETGIPCLNPILGRNSAEETYKESCDIYKYADKYDQTVFQFVHSEATRHIDPLKGRELIEQSRGKGGITPKGEREFIQMGGGAKHPVRINATGDTAHINILNALIAGFDGTDIGPVIHVHFGGRGIHDFRTKVIGGYKACQICGENKIFAQLDTHKHINNIGGTDGMAIAMVLLSEGIATHAGLPWELSGIQMNVGGVNLYRDLAIMRAFRHNMLSKSLIVVPETFQNPPANLIAEQAHFARMAISAKLGGANFYRPKAAESVGIPTGDSMGQACWATWDVLTRTYNPGIESPIIDEYENMMMDEAFAVLEATLKLPAHSLKPGCLTEEFWKQWTDMELIDLIVEAGKSGILDTPRAGGWDLKRFVKTNRDPDGITRYVAGYTPLGVDASRCPITKENVTVETTPPKEGGEFGVWVIPAAIIGGAAVIGIRKIGGVLFHDQLQLRRCGKVIDKHAPAVFFVGGKAPVVGDEALPPGKAGLLKKGTVGGKVFSRGAVDQNHAGAAVFLMTNAVYFTKSGNGKRKHQNTSVHFLQHTTRCRLLQ